MDRKDEVLASVAGAVKKVSATMTGYTGIFATLQQEHAMVNTLMSQLARTRADDEDQTERRRSLFAEIRVELLAHAAAEETTFYARLKTHHESMIDESIHEHQEMEDLLEELERLPIDSLIFDSRFKDLVACVQHHVDEEENELFPKAKEALTSAEIEHIDDAFKTQKEAQLAGFHARASSGQATARG